ncbi:hypothetical protein DFJ73DRAFT_767521 [Zopfochytrium polystomum]|nr:hypothetical protein DFJ73DRAFT_767521 [Zopfochytrium polystomum]
MTDPPPPPPPPPPYPFPTGQLRETWTAAPPRKTADGQLVCKFYAKVAVCRYGTICRRPHPAVAAMSPVVLLPGLYIDDGDDGDDDHDDASFSSSSSSSSSSSLPPQPQPSPATAADDASARAAARYAVFFAAALREFERYGKVVQLKTCRNARAHLRGNVYVQYATVAGADAAIRALEGRAFGAGRGRVVVECRRVEVASWREAICGSGKEGWRCIKGEEECGYLHPYENPGGRFREADFDWGGERRRGGFGGGGYGEGGGRGPEEGWAEDHRDEEGRKRLDSCAKDDDAWRRQPSPPQIQRHNDYYDDYDDDDNNDDDSGARRRQHGSDASGQQQHYHDAGTRSWDDWQERSEVPPARSGWDAGAISGGAASRDVESADEEYALRRPLRRRTPLAPMQRDNDDDDDCSVRRPPDSEAPSTRQHRDGRHHASDAENKNRNERDGSGDNGRDLQRGPPGQTAPYMTRRFSSSSACGSMWNACDGGAEKRNGAGRFGSHQRQQQHSEQRWYERDVGERDSEKRFYGCDGREISTTIDANDARTRWNARDSRNAYGSFPHSSLSSSSLYLTTSNFWRGSGGGWDVGGSTEKSSGDVRGRLYQPQYLRDIKDSDSGPRPAYFSHRHLVSSDGGSKRRSTRWDDVPDKGLRAHEYETQPPLRPHISHQSSQGSDGPRRSSSWLRTDTVRIQPLVILEKQSHTHTTVVNRVRSSSSSAASLSSAVRASACSSSSAPGAVSAQAEQLCSSQNTVRRRELEADTGDSERSESETGSSSEEEGEAEAQRRRRRRKLSAKRNGEDARAERRRRPRRQGKWRKDEESETSSSSASSDESGDVVQRAASGSRRKKTKRKYKKRDEKRSTKKKKARHGKQQQQRGDGVDERGRDRGGRKPQRRKDDVDDNDECESSASDLDTDVTMHETNRGWTRKVRRRRAEAKLVKVQPPSDRMDRMDGRRVAEEQRAGWSPPPPKRPSPPISHSPAPRPPTRPPLTVSHPPSRRSLLASRSPSPPSFPSSSHPYLPPSLPMLHRGGGGRATTASAASAAAAASVRHWRQTVQGAQADRAVVPLPPPPPIPEELELRRQERYC